MLQQLSAIFLQVALLSFVLTSIFLNVGQKRQWYDKDPHKIHQKDKQAVRYGGISVFLSFWIGTILSTPHFFAVKNNVWLLVASSCILLVGIIDDTIEMTPIQKSIGILLAANIVYFKTDMTFSIAMMPTIDPLLFALISYSATMAWIYAVTNAINLIDGVDGLASSVSIVSLITLSIVTYFFSLSLRMTLLIMLLSLVASLLGFLPFNWSPAKIYLGDTGALFIGFMYGALSVTTLKHASIFSLIVPVVIYMVPLFDAVYAMLRRIITRSPVGQGDREHLHHRLMRFGFSSRQVVWAMILFTSIFSLIGIAAHLWPKQRRLLFIITFIVIVILMALMKQLSKLLQMSEKRNKKAKFNKGED